MKKEIINQVIVGDAVSVLNQIPNESVDLTVTSPPYDNLRTYKGKVKDNVVYDDGFSFPFVEMARELYRVTKKGGVVVWVVNDQVKDGSETGSSFKQALKFQEIGFKLYDTMIYMKNGSSFPGNVRYNQVFEFMFVFSKGKPKTINVLKDKVNKWAGTKPFGTPSKRKKDGSLVKGKSYIVGEFGLRDNVWVIPNGKGYSTKDDEAFNHPAIFPESLAEDHILSWSNEGDVVLDPMCGSGTTLKMAKLNGRKYIGIDINKEYVEITERRIEPVVPYSIETPNPKMKFICVKRSDDSKDSKGGDKSKKEASDMQFYLNSFIDFQLNKVA
jgi:site-specific DNA-methyltransferase (adenine-specific)